MFKKLTILLLFIPLLLIPFSIKQKSEIENRQLISIDNIFDIKNFINFFKDQFPMRSSLIKFYSYLNYKTGHSINPNLFIGKDGYLFLAKQNNISLKQRGILNLSDDDIFYIKNKVTDIINWSIFNDIRIYFIPIPNQQTIHFDKLPLWHSRLSNQDRYEVFKNIFSELGYESLFIDLRHNLIKNNTEEAPTYYKLEGHWTNYGKMIALNDILTQLNIVNENKYSFFKRLVTWPEHYMTEDVTDIKIQNLNFNKKIILDDGYEKYYEFSNLLENNDTGSLLIWGDSFTLDPFPLYFINNFSSVLRISSNHQQFPKDIILASKPKTIFIMLSERNFFERNLFGPIADRLN